MNALRYSIISGYCDMSISGNKKNALEEPEAAGSRTVQAETGGFC
jgi:hypothetical protein